jgi:hypothetical protein
MTQRSLQGPDATISPGTRDRFEPCVPYERPMSSLANLADEELCFSAPDCPGPRGECRLAVWRVDFIFAHVPRLAHCCLVNVCAQADRIGGAAARKDSLQLHSIASAFSTCLSCTHPCMDLREFIEPFSVSWMTDARIPNVGMQTAMSSCPRSDLIVTDTEFKFVVCSFPSG